LPNLIQAVFENITKICK